MYFNCHSYHSLRYGTIPLKDLVLQAKDLGVTTMALTDINTVTGVYDFVKECWSVGIKPIAGIEFRAGNNLLYVGLAKNREGFGEMNRFLTQYNISKENLPKIAPVFNNVAIVYPLQNIPSALRDNEYVGIRPQELIKLYSAQYKMLLYKMVVLQPVTFRVGEKKEKEYNLHKILRAIDNNTILSKLIPDDYCHVSEIMLQVSKLKERYINYPEIITATEALMDSCSFEFYFDKKKIKRNKIFFTNNREGDFELLTKLAYEGMERRYGKNNQNAIDRIKKELEVINILNFCAHYLIVWDMIEFSKTKGFLHIGRGSGANSIISYCLDITDICPLELNLYFERFLNLNRSVPPDFDIDWSWKDRDTILDYVFEKYKGHVAFTGTIAFFKYRSILREVGKVFGLPKEELDKLIKAPASQHDDNYIIKLVHDYGMMLEKYPNQRGMHACGVLISEEPITNFSALELPPKGYPVVQFDMHTAEEISLEKFDILSQRGIGHINDTIKLIEKNRGIKVDIRNTALSKNEVASNEFLSRGNTIGCFYIESPAMRGLLRRLKCDNYNVLVAASSIIRPGVAQSGMMKEYIFRHNNPDKFEYFHEIFKKELGDTYGIMVYQEDVIKIAFSYGGLSLADGDTLRRGMTGKNRSRSEIDGVKSKFFNNCKERGYPEQLSQEIYRQIESFAGFSFCKAHSASYATESYQSLYLKVYYPLEFIVAVINNQGGFYRPEVYVHEARMSGAVIYPPCVNRSNYEATLYEKDIYLGFMHLQSIQADLINTLLGAREQHGTYKNLKDFIERVPVTQETLQKLICAGAFNFTEKTKYELFFLAQLLFSRVKPQPCNLSLFDEPEQSYILPLTKKSIYEDAFDELEFVGFPISCSPFDILQTKYRGGVMAKDLLNYHKEKVRMVAYLISRKHVPTNKGEMYFGTWIDFKGDYFDTAHFPDSLANNHFKGGGCYLLEGNVEVDYHFPTITIHKMERLPFMQDPRYYYREDRQENAQKAFKEDISMTSRPPYPSEHQIELPRNLNFK